MNNRIIQQPPSGSVLKTVAVVILLSLFMLSGCSVKHPVPRTQYPQPVPPPQPQPTTPTPAPVPQTPKIYKPAMGAASSLYKQAQSDLARGRYNNAELLMERALRIEPRNGHYWHTMAKIKYSMGNYPQAIQLCLKSNSFATGNSQLRRLNDSLIQKAKNSLQ